MAARDSVLLLALYPTAFVFTSAYSEGSSSPSPRRRSCRAARRPWLAGLLGARGGDAAHRARARAGARGAAWPRTRAQLPQLAPVVLLPLMGLAAVALTFDLELDDALAFLHAQGFWARDPSWLGPLAGI